MRDRWPESTQDRAVELYMQGLKYKEITAETGVPQATLQVWLAKRGVTPNRSPRFREPIANDQLLERYDAAMRRIGQLEAEVARLRGLLGETDGKSDVASGFESFPKEVRNSP